MGIGPCTQTPQVSEEAQVFSDSSETQNSPLLLQNEIDDLNQTHNSNSEPESPLDSICKLRVANPDNPLLGYLNINSLRNKIVDVREIMSKFSPDYFVLAETKLDESFPTAQFNIDGYEIRTRKDRNIHGGGLIEYVGKGVICKQLHNIGIVENEIICSEITIRNKKWIIISIYRPPSYLNLTQFSYELEKILNNALSKCDNIIVLGDINIDFYNPSGSGYGQMQSLCDISISKT